MADLAASNEYPVYLGYWTNWSYGRVQGATITLSNRNGALLTAFLAVFVTFAGQRLWKIACFALHQWLSSDKAQDGLYHQRQAILRNATTEMNTLENLIRVLSAWRRRANQPLRRIIPLIGLAIISVSAFTAASILSSKISSAMGDEVLISSRSCGAPSPAAEDGNARSNTIYFPWVSQNMMNYLNYAQNCYSNASVEGCDTYIKRKLPSMVERNASCPFKRLCRYENRSIKLDTGPLNSHIDLGINAPEDLRFTMRTVNHCAPLVMDGFKEVFNYSSDISYMRYFYGNEYNTGVHGHTYEYRQRSNSEVIFENFTSAPSDYTTCVMSAFTYNGSLYSDGGVSTFSPIDELFEGDGDLGLIFLSANAVQYAQEVNDPWYAAHQYPGERVDAYQVGINRMYFADEPASVIGCKKQYKICDLKNQACSQLAGWEDATNFADASGGNRSQAISWIWGNGADFTLLVEYLGALSLTSRHTLGDGVQGPLPDNQWQLDVENWHNVMLASYQYAAVQSAKGPGNPGMLEYFWARPETREEKYFCKNQKILSKAYTNFSVLWLAIVLIVGCLIMIVSYTFESAILWIEKRRNVIKPSRLEWFTNDAFQLQRLAHEELGVGTWIGCVGTRAIPVTEKGELLAVLDISDPEHPMLMIESKESAEGKVDSSTDQTNAAASENNDADQTANVSEIAGGDQTDVDSANTATHQTAEHPDNACPVQNPTTQSSETTAVDHASYTNLTTDSPWFVIADSMEQLLGDDEPLHRAS